MIKKNDIEIVAAFVLYNPTERDINNVKKISSCYDLTLIFDNTPENNHNIKKFNDDHLLYFSDGSNNGLARAYNMAIKEATMRGAFWLTFFDQDSRIDSKSVTGLIQFVKKCDNKRIAIAAPFIQYLGSKEVDITRSRSVDWAINSGSTLNLELLSEYNISYDEAYFLDRLDRDFCMQIKKAGLQIIQVKNVILYQKLGTFINGKKNHTPLRHYYIFRNRFYYNKKWIHNGAKRNAITFAQTAHHVYQIIADESDKMAKLKMLPLALRDYKEGNFGKKCPGTNISK